MSLALNSLILFFLLIFPGIIFRRFYYTSEFSKQFVLRDPFKSFVSNIIPGIVIQAFTLIMFHSSYEKIDVSSLLEVFFHYDIDSHLIDSKKEGAKSIKESLSSLITYDSLVKFGKYLCLLLVLSVGLARVFRFIVRKLKLDIKIKLLRFQNEWHYLFKGEVKDFKNFKGKILNESHTTYIDVLTNHEDDKALFYTGLLTDYTLCGNTRKLEHLYLTNAKRYDSTKPKKERFQKIPGHILVIPYDKVKNFNLRFQEVVRDIDFKARNNMYVIFLILTSLLTWFIDSFYKLIEIVFSNSFLFYEKLITQILLVLFFFAHMFIFRYTYKKKMTSKNPEKKYIFYSIFLIISSVFLWVKFDLVSIRTLFVNAKGIFLIKLVFQFILITAYTIIYTVFIHNLKPEHSRNIIFISSFKSMFYFLWVLFGVLLIFKFL